MFTIFKKSDTMVIVSYDAKSKYFDLLLDSVKNIIYNFNILEKTFEIDNTLNLKKSNVKYSKLNEFDNLIKENNTYEIAYSNYKVVYEIPTIFKLSTLDTTSNKFQYDDSNDLKIIINTNIYNKNVYEYLDRNSLNNVYRNYTFKDFKITDYKEYVSKLDGYSDSYIYKNFYKKEETKINDKLEIETYKQNYENMEIIYNLNKNHILVIKINSNNSITKKLVDAIKIKKVLNYANYTNHKIENDYVTFELKRYAGSSVNNVVIKLPKDYEEIDKNSNLYQNRYFKLNYDYKKELYDYEIHYELSGISKIDDHIKVLNSLFKKYGEYHYYDIGNEVLFNNKKFIEYNGGYTDLGGIMFTDINRYSYYVNHKILFYKINNEYLLIEIKGNGKEISSDIVNAATNFEIKSN